MLCKGPKNPKNANRVTITRKFSFKSDLFARVGLLVPYYDKALPLLIVPYRGMSSSPFKRQMTARSVWVYSDIWHQKKLHYFYWGHHIRNFWTRDCTFKVLPT